MRSGLRTFYMGALTNSATFAPVSHSQNCDTDRAQPAAGNVFGQVHDARKCWKTTGQDFHWILPNSMSCVAGGERREESVRIDESGGGGRGRRDAGRASMTRQPDGKKRGGEGSNWMTGSEIFARKVRDG